MGPVYIGTSGWSYKSWENTFYPNQLAGPSQFAFYASQFPTVEINATFYRLPGLPMVRGWRDKAPPGFVFAVKGSRYITHLKRIADLDGALDRFFERLKPLQPRIGVVLWQLPPNLKMDLKRLESFLELLPPTYRHALEFRHPSWITPSVFKSLRQHSIAHVSVSSLRMPMDLTVTTDLVYIRFHGLEDGAAHDYSRKELDPWAKHIRKQAARGNSVYAYFNNDANVRAPANARTLMSLVGRIEAEP